MRRPKVGRGREDEQAQTLALAAALALAPHVNIQAPPALLNLWARALVLQGLECAHASGSLYPRCLPAVLDLGACPSLLYLSADSTLTFSRVILQGE